MKDCSKREMLVRERERWNGVVYITKFETFQLPSVDSGGIEIKSHPAMSPPFCS